MNAGRAQETVLFIHSTGTGPFLWSGVASETIGGRRAICPANLGYEPNPPITRGERVTAADDAAQLMRGLQVDGRLHIVAHSYGGLVGLHVLEALRRQAEDRIASVFLYEPVLFGALARGGGDDPEAIAQAKSFGENPWFLSDEERGGREEWLEVFVDYWNRPGSWKKMPEPMREMSRAVGWKMFQEVRSCFLDETSFDAWLPDRTTIVVGDRSPIASRAMSRALAAGRPGTTLVDLGGASHMSPLTNGAIVHAELARHFARIEL